jgi:hypothetical protein
MSDYLAATARNPTALAGDAASQSAVSWGAIFAGGVAAAAIALLLTILGAGLGLAVVSPWAGHGASPLTFTVMAAIWLIIVQWVASFFGGFLAGRLRTKWVGVHSDEVTFRDTAHGLMAWSVAMLLTFGSLALAGLGAVNAGGKAAAAAGDMTVTNNYYVTELFKPAMGGAATGVSLPGATPQQMRQDATIILAQSAVTGQVSDDDKSYLATLVAGATGLDPSAAAARVNAVLGEEQANLAKAKQMANEARKSASAAAIYTFFAGLIGAFIAAVAGLVGGRLRDLY